MISVTDDPLLRAYYHAGCPEPKIASDAWMAEARKRTIAHELRKARYADADAVWSAQTHWWSEQMFDTLFDLPLPSHHIQKPCYDSLGFHLFPFVLCKLKSQNADERIPSIGMVLRLRGDRIETLWIHCHGLGDPNDAPTAREEKYRLVIEPDNRIGDWWDSPGDGGVNISLAVQALLRTKVVATTRQKFPRQFRRHVIPREDRDTDVTVVALRRTFMSAVRKYDEETEERRRGHWVSMHWRQQAYGPKMALRRPHFIEPHQRGDLDNMMPTRVFAVAR